jgi:hypothetical protein
MGRRGSVDAILTVLKGVYVQSRQQFIPRVLYRDKNVLCLFSVRENSFRVHIAIEAPRISTIDAKAMPRITAIGPGLFAGVAQTVGTASVDFFT